jgi:S1-C subfamily serine protease
MNARLSGGLFFSVAAHLKFWRNLLRSKGSFTLERRRAMDGRATDKHRRRLHLPLLVLMLATLAGTAVGIEQMTRPRLNEDDPRNATELPPPAMSRAPDGHFTVLTYLPDDVKGPTRRVAEQTVIVRTDGGFASGFIVRDGYVVTAAHAASHDDMTTAHVRCWDVDAEADVVRIDALRDVMILHAAHCGGATLGFDTRPLREHEPVSVSGFTFNFDVNGAYRYHRTAPAVPDAAFATTDERISAHMKKMRANGVPRLRAIGTVLVRGNSGSPVCAEDGGIVGMFVIMDYPTRLAYMVPAETVVRVLSDANIR